MASLNRAELIGHLGRDPEIRSFPDGGKVASFTVATSRKWKHKSTGEIREETEWHRVEVTNDGTAKIVEQYARKGSRVYVSGRLRTRKWQDRDGRDCYTTEILVAPYGGEVILLGDPRGEGQGGQRQDPGPSSQGGTTGGTSGGRSDIDDEIPF